MEKENHNEPSAKVNAIWDNMPSLFTQEKLSIAGKKFAFSHFQEAGEGGLSAKSEKNIKASL